MRKKYNWNCKDIYIAIILLNIVYVGIDLMWIGAEYLFEGQVHTSKVDGVVCGVLSLIIIWELWLSKCGNKDE